MKTFEEVMELTRTVSSNTALEDAEARALYECCCDVPMGGIVVEVGSQLGRSSSLILQAAKDIGFRSVHIDPYIENPEYLPKWSGTMKMIGYSFSLLCMRTVEAIPFLISLEHIDMAFIDGDHEYGGVITDLSWVADKVRPGGTLACHDYGRESLPDVFKAVNKYLESGQWEEVGIYGTLGVWRRK